MESLLHNHPRISVLSVQKPTLLNSNPSNHKTETRFKGFLSAPQFLPEGEHVGNFEFPSDINFEQVEVAEPRPGLRLGHVAEHFFEAAIQCTYRYKLLDSHIQVIVEGRTLGELDYIIFDRESRTTTHVELAFKFYLFDPAISGPEAARWMGPNQNDSLLLKLKKLHGRQFPLLLHPAAQILLSQKGIAAGAIQQALCIKGHFFVPFDFQGSLPSAYINMVTGVWMRRTDFAQANLQGSVFAPVQKRDWFIDLTKDTPDTCFTWMDKATAIDHIDASHRSGRSLMIWSKHPDHTYQRICVVWW